MSAQRHVLIVATQCDSMPHLDRLAEAARELHDVLTDDRLGGCRAGLPDGRALVTGELEQAEIDAVVRDAVEHAGKQTATLVLALLGHGFVPGDHATLYLMAKGSVENNPNTAVNVPALLAGAADRHGVAGLIAVVDTCNAAGAQLTGGALTAGARQGRIRFDALMASAVHESAIDFSMSRTLAELLRAGFGDAPTLTADALAPALTERIDHQSIVLSRYAGEPGLLWLGRNPRIATESGRFGAYGYQKYRTAMRSAMDRLAEVPPIGEALTVLSGTGRSPLRERAERVVRDLDVVRDTVELLRRPPMRTALTPKALRAASPVHLPGEFFVPGAVSDADVVSYLVLNPPVGQSGRAQLVKFVLTLAEDTGCSPDDEALRRWIDGLDLVVFANEVRGALRERRTKQDLRLIVSLHASLTGSWPEVVKAWLWHGDEEIDNAEHPCRPTPDDVKRAIIEALARAEDLADVRGLVLRRIEVAAPAGLLLSWHPEEIEYLVRIGVSYDVVLHWSDRFRSAPEIRYANQLLRRRLREDTGTATTPFEWLSDAQLRHTTWLRDQLKGNGLGTAVAIASRPADPEAVLALLLMFAAIVIWPSGATAPGDPRADLLEVWNQLPTGFLEAYRRRWRNEPDRNALAHLRAVWDDEKWLDFCRDMQRRRAQEGTS